MKKTVKLMKLLEQPIPIAVTMPTVEPLLVPVEAEPHEVVPQAHHGRGRPPKVGVLRMRELRLTPVDGEPIDFVENPGISKMVAFEEGGHGTEKKLHYHAILETTLNEDALKGYCYRLTRGKGTEGNKAFMSREVLPEDFDKTTGYISKHKKPVFLKGYVESDLHKWYVFSDEYVSNLKRETDKYRKIKALGRKRELLSVEQDIKHELENTPDGERHHDIAGHIVKRFIDLCKERNFDFPTRTQMEGIVNRLRYDYDLCSVYAFYRRGLKSFEEDITRIQHYGSSNW